MIFVVDASVAVKWLVAEPGHEHATSLLLKAPTLLAPDLIEVEVANVLWKKTRRGEIDRTQASQALDALPRFFDALEPSSRFVARALEIALDLDHAIYDCVYLAAAERSGVRLATADARLARKCSGTAYAERIISIDRNLDSHEPA
ncbi:MAG TPA: type II toxin-antitoxin system VapC family toxin [Methylosinus sp.]